RQGKNAGPLVVDGSMLPLPDRGPRWESSLFPIDGSHWVNMKVIIEALHSRGHQVSVVRSSDSWYIEEKSPFYNSITLGSPSEFDESFITTFIARLLEIQREGKSFWTRYKLEIEQAEMTREMYEKTSEFVEMLLENKDLMQSIKNTNYDLVFTDPVAPVGAILANYLKLPLVFSARGTSHGESHFDIAPSPISYIPLTGTQLSDQMSFFERLQNVLMFGFLQYQIRWFVTPSFEDLIKKYFAADLWLMRVDFVYEYPRPTMPNVVYIGGFQCKPAKPLPEHLEEFVQSSGEHGVIVMSLGTLIAELPQDLADQIAAAFAKMPQKVIWRYKRAKPATLGNNTLLVDWMPQNDLLGHPKTNHGGTNGIYEAIYHGVPIVGIPLVFDQADNLSRLRAKGVTKLLDISELDSEIFQKAIEEVLNEPLYALNMQRLSRLHRDAPMKPMDSALFWIEFVMRHKGAAHLRTESYRLPWYSYHSVDVLLFLIAVVFLVLLVFVVLVWSCFRLYTKIPKILSVFPFFIFANAAWRPTSSTCLPSLYGHVYLLCSVVQLQD
uniref:UDP glucuronosyltransferase 5 family, polypeptide F1 n=1 Tax=Takifugu rubripes TaxID=31033 RepID=A0A674P1U1_TAKRU